MKTIQHIIVEVCDRELKHNQTIPQVSETINILSDLIYQEYDDVASFPNDWEPDIIHTLHKNGLRRDQARRKSNQNPQNP